MFKRLAEIFSSFFSFFMGGDKPKPNPRPVKNDTDGLIEDSSDVPVDTVMTVDVHDTDITIIDGDSGPFADPDKETATDGSATDEPTNEPEPTGDGGSSTSDNDGRTEEPGSSTSDDTSVPSTPPPTTRKQKYLWCLDNGHGKLQAGKRSPIWDTDDGKVQFFEYEFNRDIVERIIKKLDKAGVAYYDVVPDVINIGSFLKERVARANKKRSDLPRLFVSVHANAGPAPVGKWVSSSIKGVETWFAHNSRKGKKWPLFFKNTSLPKRVLKTAT